MTLHTMTSDQEAYLNSLIVQRLHDASKNRNLISNFFNKTNPNLARDLHEGWKDDQNGETAYYVVKDPNDSMILLYFSLRCGSLHAPDPYDRIQADYKRAEALYAAAKGLKSARKWALDMIEAYKAQGYDADGLIDHFKRICDNRKAWLKALKKDAKHDPSQMTVQTVENYSGVELVQFCKNDRAEDLWKNSCVGNVPMGECLFWRFILLVIPRTTKLVGCKYVYLFAADSSEACFRRHVVMGEFQNRRTQVRIRKGIHLSEGAVALPDGLSQGRTTGAEQQPGRAEYQAFRH